MPAVCRIGDKDAGHCSGTSRAEGYARVKINNIPVSAQGHKNTSHSTPGKVCLPHAKPIEKGSSSVFVDNGSRGIGRVGDGISSCTSVAQGSPNVFAGG